MPFFHLFILFRSSVDWMMPNCIYEGNLLHSIYQFKCQSVSETYSQKNPEIMFSQLSRHSSHNANHQTIIVYLFYCFITAYSTKFSLPPAMEAFDLLPHICFCDDNCSEPPFTCLQCSEKGFSFGYLARITSS